MDLSFTLKKSHSTFLLIIYTWLGLIYSRISYHFGGVALIGVGYLLLIAVLSPWKIKFKNEDYELYTAIKWFIFFVCVFVIGTEGFHRYTKVKTISSFSMGVDTFHMIKSFPIWLSFFYIQKKGTDNTRFDNLLIWLLLIDMLLTLFALSTIPNFAKNLTAGITTEEMLPYKLWGAMGYELTYSIIMIVPLLFAIAYFSRSKLWWITAFISILYVYRCSFLLALALMIVNICLAWFFSIKQPLLKALVMGVLIITIIVLFMHQVFIGELLLTISTKVESVELRLRFEQLSDALLFGDTSGEALYRFTLYKNALIGVLKSPILGSYIVDPSFHTSEHSAVLDIWGAFGLLGIIPFFQVIRHLYRYSVQNITKSSLKGIVFASYATFILFATLNPLFADPHIFACGIWVIPTLSRILQNNASNREYCIYESRTNKHDTLWKHRKNNAWHSRRFTMHAK